MREGSPVWAGAAAGNAAVALFWDHLCDVDSPRDAGTSHPNALHPASLHEGCPQFQGSDSALAQDRAKKPRVEHAPHFTDEA